MPKENDAGMKPARLAIKRVGRASDAPVASAEPQKVQTEEKLSSQTVAPEVPVAEAPAPAEPQENPTAMPAAGEGPVHGEPVPVRGRKDAPGGTSPLGFCFKIGGLLLAVCAVVTLMLSLVNALTADRISENKQKDMNLAIKEIFKDSDTSAPLSGDYSEPVTGVYSVSRGEHPLGYAVSVVTSGFGGDIEMMVGIGRTGAVTGVRIISLSETPGVGSRVNDVAYLSGYVGKSGSLVLKSDVDAVSGATISSKAVLAGVNAALALKLKVEGAVDEEESMDSETVDTDTPIPADSSLAIIPVPEGSAPDVSVETVYREETSAPAPTPDESEIVAIVTEPNKETEPADTTVPADAVPPDDTSETVAVSDSAEPTDTTVAP